VKRKFKSKSNKFENKDNRNNRNIWLLGWSSFFNDVGSEMITPILPFLVISLGGGGLAIGALSGIREGLSSIVKLFGGWYSDKIGKRIPFVFLGYLVSVVSRFLLILANSWQWVLGFVSIERLGKARDAPRDALISQSTKEKGKGFGIQQMLDTGGAIIGSLIVLFLLWRLTLNFKLIILVAGAVSVFSLLPLFFVKEPKIKPQKKSLFKGIKLLDKKLKYFIFVMAVFTLVNFGLYMFLILRAKEITQSMIIAIALGVLFNFIWAGFSIPFGSLSDKIGRKKILMAGYILFLFVCIGFIFSKSVLSLAVLFIAYGLIWAIMNTAPRALISDLSKTMRGTAYGFFQFVMGVVSIIGGLIAGFLWDISPEIMFAYMASVAVLSIILFYFVKE